MSGQKRWIGARAAGLVALAMLCGCSDRQTGPAPKPDGEQEDGGATNVPKDGGGIDALDAGALPEWLIDGGDPRTYCPVARELDDVLALTCPERDRHGQPCEPAGAHCVTYYLEPPPMAGLLVCSATCGDEAAATWVIECAAGCKRTCAEPPPETMVFELDASDCTRRPLTDCGLGLTLQNQLDAQLRALMPSASNLIELHNATVTFDFENGCATRFYSPGRAALPMFEPMAREALAGLRLSCAIALGCGEVLGHSTIGTQ